MLWMKLKKMIKMANEFPERYELKSGKFGPYFYDNVRSEAIGLDEIHKLLNKKPKEMDLAQIKNDITIYHFKISEDGENGNYKQMYEHTLKLLYLIQLLEHF